MNPILASSDLPYPEINVTPSLSEARILMPSYGGRHSETTAVMTYVYQSYVSKEFSDTLEAIAISEMRHHDLLGNAIVKLGGYPVIGSGTYWNGSYVNYQTCPAEFLKANIIGEKTAIAGYERAILSLDQKDLKLLLERIILDEELHIKIFEELLTGLNCGNG